VTRNEDSNPKVDWIGLGWQFLFFWYFSGVIQLLVKLSKTSATGNFRFAMLMSLLWLIPTTLSEKDPYHYYRYWYGIVDYITH